MRLFGLSVGMGVAVLMAGGCGQARYSGAEPTVRSFNENGGIKDTYVGFDLGFVVEQDEPHVPGLHRVVER